MKSLLSVSMHKAGSTIADQIILEICRARGYRIDRISTRVSASPLPEQQVFISSQDQLADTGFYYGMARGMYVKDMPRIYGLKLIMQVRDPRDCVTSSYFSRRESHVAPRNPAKRIEFEKKRLQAREVAIDEYARRFVKQYAKRMRILRKICESHDDMLLLRYEEMVEETDTWLTDISHFLAQPLTDKLVERLKAKLDFSVAEEDPSKHKRQVSPGDHGRKLKGETISYMNRVAGEEMKYFGYEC